MNISNAIREYRKKRGMNQFELAEEIGVSVDSVRRWESNKQYPRADEMKNLASVLGVRVDDLLNGSTSDSWELRLVVSRGKEGGTIDMTSSRSSAVLNIGDDAMAVTLSAPYELWEDDAKFEELIADLKRKRAIGLKTRLEDW